MMGVPSPSTMMGLQQAVRGSRSSFRIRSWPVRLHTAAPPNFILPYGHFGLHQGTFPILQTTNFHRPKGCGGGRVGARQGSRKWVEWVKIFQTSSLPSDSLGLENTQNLSNCPMVGQCCVQLSIFYTFLT